MNKKGFTLIELLVTLVVLGIVVGIVLVYMNYNIEDAKKKSEDIFVGTIRDAMDMYLAQDARGLDFNTTCSDKLDKKHDSEVYVYMADVSFNNVISSNKSLVESEFVNPANDKQCSVNANVEIYRDDDYVYYYRILKKDFDCFMVATDDDFITNLPLEEFSC